MLVELVIASLVTIGNSYSVNQHGFDLSQFGIPTVTNMGLSDLSVGHLYNQHGFD